MQQSVTVTRARAVGRDLRGLRLRLRRRSQGGAREARGQDCIEWSPKQMRHTSYVCPSALGIGRPGPVVVESDLRAIRPVGMKLSFRPSSALDRGCDSGPTDQ
eukprot:2530489-Amphidinium_carterae.1